MEAPSLNKQPEIKEALLQTGFLFIPIIAFDIAILVNNDDGTTKLRWKTIRGAEREKMSYERLIEDDEKFGTKKERIKRLLEAGVQKIEIPGKENL